MKKNKILALILARKNSRRLKNKNILSLGGKPLINWTIDDALKLKAHFKDIILSSDSKKILKIGKNKNIITVSRPKKYSTSYSTSEESALHTIRYYENFYSKDITHILLLQPTSPFRSKKEILQGLKLSNKFKNDRIISCNLINNKNVPNGNFYICPKNTLKKKGKFESKKFKPLKTRLKKNQIDIDLEKDFILAKKYV